MKRYTFYQIWSLVATCVGLLMMGFTTMQDTSSDEALVFLMELKAPIDPRTNRYVDLALHHAPVRRSTSASAQN